MCRSYLYREDSKTLQEEVYKIFDGTMETDKVKEFRYIVQYLSQPENYSEELRTLTMLNSEI